MDRYTNMLSQMLEEVGPRDAWSFQADLSLILYTLQQDEGILKAASQSGQWADMVRICARQVYDLPSDHRQPLENLSETCSAILRTLLQNLAQDQQLLCQNAAALLDELLQQMIDRKYTSDLIPPRSLADMMAAMAVPQAPCRILDPVCGSSRLLLAACGINHAAELLGIARSESIAAAALLRLRLGGIENGHVERADFFSRVPHLAERFDVILANPPYDKDLRDTFRYIYAFLNLLKPDGRCAVLVPEGLLNNTTSQDAVELRDFLLHCHDLEAVVSLPLRIYWPYTTSHSSLLLFRKGQGRQEVFFGRIPDREDLNRGLPDQFYRPDMAQILRAWNSWSAGKLLPEDTESLCWTVSWENIERTRDHVLSAEQYEFSPYVHQKQQIGALEQVRQCQIKLEHLLLRHMAEQEAGDEM